MNPGGLAEETGSTLRTFINSMKEQPALLLMAFSNLLLVAFLYYALHGAAEFRSDLIKQTFEYQKQVTDVLSRCVVPQRGDIEQQHGDLLKEFHHGIGNSYN